MYIGKATNIRSRIKVHKTSLRKGKHRNAYLQNAWNYYREQNFLFEILIECPKEYLSSEEHYWCNLLNVHDPKRGYNIRPTHPYGKDSLTTEHKIKIGEANRGKKHSNEFKRKCSERLKGIPTKRYRKHSIQTKKKISLTKKKNPPLISIIAPVHRKVQQLLNGTLIKEWNNIGEILTFYNISNNTLWRVRSGINVSQKNKHLAMYEWKFIGLSPLEIGKQKQKK
jgi:group I intron endonuclease